MSCELEPIRAEGEVHRLGRKPDPWAWPEWAYAGEDGTFGNRYDDPRSAYRVLYASSLRLGTLLETLARFRPDPAILAVEIEGDPRDETHETLTAGVIPASWLENRALSTARCDAVFADIGHARSLACLRTALAAEVVRYGLDDLDAGAIRASVPRGFTQEVSRHVYECTEEQGDDHFKGLDTSLALATTFAIGQSSSQLKSTCSTVPSSTVTIRISTRHSRYTDLSSDPEEARASDLRPAASTCLPRATLPLAEGSRTADGVTDESGFEYPRRLLRTTQFAEFLCGTTVHDAIVL